MMLVRAVPVAILLALATPALAQQAESPKRADIEQVLDMTGSLAVGQQMSAAMTAQITSILRDARPDVPQRVLDVLREEIDATLAENIGDLETLIVDIYDTHFTADEIKGMIAFYSTPLGRKMVETMPAIVAESMAAGNQWGRSLAPVIDQRISARLKQEGF